ncbi:MAG: YceI family protein [Rhodanobacteraceae bacterium]
MRLLASLILLLCCSAAPANETIRIDSAHSNATFAVRTLWFKNIEGRVAGLRGTVAMDDSQRSRVEVQIDVDQVRMDNPHYKAMLRSKEFFDTENYPTISFRSRDFDTHLLFDGGNIDGHLTMRGVTQAVTFELSPEACEPNRLSDCRIDVRGLIQRSNFGMTAYRFTLSDHVQLRLVIRLVAP